MAIWKTNMPLWPLVYYLSRIHMDISDLNFTNIAFSTGNLKKLQFILWSFMQIAI